MEVNRIIQGDVLAELRKLPDNLVDTIATSCPYWGLRDYGIKGQVGLESTLEEYINKLLAITLELKRVLKPTGVMFWNHGDCYGSAPPGNSPENIEEWASKGDGLIGRKFKRYGTFKKSQSVTPKCLALQNYRLILRMIDQQGWILRNTIIWDKPNHMPSSVKDRFANSYEPVFMLVKQQKYWFDLDAVRKPHTNIQDFERHAPFNYRVREAKKGHDGIIGVKSHQKEMAKYDRKGIRVPGQRPFGIHRKRHSGYQGANGEYLVDPRGKNPGDVWTIPTQPFPQAHFATFPEKLIEPMILAGCPEWICKKCGKARVRITEPDKEYAKHLGTWTKDTDKSKKLRDKIGFQAHSKKEALTAQYKTIGWTVCKCVKKYLAERKNKVIKLNEMYNPGIALDPFMGAGTVGVVAKSLGRQYLGIELSPDYIKIAEKRLLNTMGRLL